MTIHTHLKSSLICIFVTGGLSACGGGGGGAGEPASAGGGFTSLTNTKPISSSIASISSQASSTIPKSSSSTSTSKATGVDLVAPTVPESFDVGLKIYDAVDLNWSPSTDNIGVTSYKIYRDNVQIGDAADVDTTFLDFDVAPDRSYSYGISAVDAAGNASAIKTITVRTPTAPIFSGTSSSKNANSSVESSSASSTNSSSSKLSSASANSSSSKSATSQASSSSSSAGPDTVPPQAPQSIVNKALFSTRVDIEWTPGTDNRAVASYRIYRDEALLTTVKAEVLTYSDTNVFPNKSYLYAVETVDSSGNTSLTRKTLGVSTPAAATNGDVTLLWAAPTQREDDSALPGSDLGGYVIQYKLKASSNFLSFYITDSSATSYIIPSLVGDYEFQIAAYDKNNLFSKFVSLQPH